MQTRRDQLHAYRFMTRRAMSALVTGEPDSVEPPMRRITLFTIAGIMIAIAVAAVFAVIGLLKGGASDDWKTEGTVIVEEETGARFVMIGDKLHPALNYASAVLATTSTDPVNVQLVPREDLGEVERGETIGIPGLPDSMPSAEELVEGPTTVCSQPEDGGATVMARVTVDVGTEVAVQRVAEDEAVHVESVDGERYLLYRGRRHAIASPDVASVLGINVSAVKVGTAFLNAVPVGMPLQPPEFEGKGRRVTDTPVGEMRVGQVIEVSDGSHRVMLRDGVMPITDVQAKLLGTLKLGGQRRTPVDMDLNTQVLDMDEVDDENIRRQAEGLPGTMPQLTDAARESGGACAIFSDGEAQPQLATPAGTASRAPTEESKQSEAGQADEVSIKPGTALLAAAPPSQTVNLVAEPGRIYTAASLEVLGGFGYGDVEPVQLPPELLNMIPRHQDAALDPQDESLNPEAARTAPE